MIQTEGWYMTVFPIHASVIHWYCHDDKSVANFKIKHQFFMIYREDGGSKALWNTSKYMPVYRISHFRQELSPIPMWECQIPPIWACLISLTVQTLSPHVINLHITISPDGMDFLNRVLCQEFLYRELYNLVSLVPCCFLWPLTDEPCLKILHKSKYLAHSYKLTT